MSVFYTNKYPIVATVKNKEGEWSDLPEGNIFTISGIQNDFFILEPISEIKGLMQISCSIQMLDRGFTKSDKVFR